MWVPLSRRGVYQNQINCEEQHDYEKNSIASGKPTLGTKNACSDTLLLKNMEENL